MSAEEHHGTVGIKFDGTRKQPAVRGEAEVAASPITVGMTTNDELCISEHIKVVSQQAR